MAGTATYLNHGPMWVIYNAVNLGFLNEGEVTLTINQDWVDQLCHQTGSHVVQSYFKGEQVDVEASLAEITNLDNWVVAFQTAQKQKDTATPPINRIASGSATTTAPYIGTTATSVAKVLILRPVSLYTDASTETAQDFVIPKAFCRNAGAIPHGIDTANVLPLHFSGIFDPAATEGEYLWVRGKLTGTGAWTAA